MSDDEIKLARHALGLPNRQRESYRNYFCAGESHDDYPAWMAMVERGDAIRRSAPSIIGNDFYFHRRPRNALSS